MNDKYRCSQCDKDVNFGFHSTEQCRADRLSGLMPKPAEPEKVDHPAHYGGDTPYEAIKVIEAWGLGFCLGNTVKYISRAGKKSANVIEDLKKAEWYLKREIERLEAGQ